VEEEPHTAEHFLFFEPTAAAEERADAVGERLAVGHASDCFSDAVRRQRTSRAATRLQPAARLGTMHGENAAVIDLSGVSP
jgi:hypothetical protein